MAKKSAKPAAPSKKTRVDVIPGAVPAENEKAPVESKHEETRNVPGEEVKLPVRRVATPADPEAHESDPDTAEPETVPLPEEKVENVAQAEKE